MPGWKDIANIWKNVREVDLRPIREDAVREVQLVLVGAQGSGRHILADQLRSDPGRPGVNTHTPVLVVGLELEEQVAGADLFVIMIDAREAEVDRQRRLAHSLSSAGKKVLVFFNQEAGGSQAQALDLEALWDAQDILSGPVTDTAFLLEDLVPAVLDLLPDDHLALGRRFPLFRVAVATKLINDTCFSNAAYSLSTGLAETVPVLDIPLNITDMVVLTKAQAFLVYRLGLTLGFSTRWQDYITEFGSVMGGGFLWRQLARQLVGLIPVWGILPKVAVSYAGTYVVGHVVLRWYLTGRHISPRQMKELYRQSFIQGKAVARRLMSKIPRPRFGRRKPMELPTTVEIPQLTGIPSFTDQICPNCGKSSAVDAKFCQYCGQALPDSGQI